MPHCAILAGPNGAGKSTAAPHLVHSVLGIAEFVNADVIARGLAGNGTGATIAEGRRGQPPLVLRAAAWKDFEAA